jgi:spore maturation protein CgeB
MNEAVVFLCSENELNRERQGYFKAFSKIIKTVCIPYDKLYCNDELKDLLPQGIIPKFLLSPDSWPRLLPHGLTNIPYPTACFQIDTFEQPEARAFFSMLFDYAFVFHPGFDRQFQNLGHPKAVCIPHAVEADLFESMEQNRIYEVGWVGRLDGQEYNIRRRYIEGLKKQFAMNEIEQYYPPEAMAKIYQLSKVVVNLSRDDHLHDANLRCFEVMAAGALLITPQPTELAELGFVEGTHYVTFQTESQMYEIVQYYLKNDEERDAISQAARALVLQQHTYDVRAKTILDTVDKNQGKLFSPARQWEKVKVHATYLEYFTGSMMLESALHELHEIRRYSLIYSCSMLPMIMKCFLIKFRDSLVI